MKTSFTLIVTLAIVWPLLAGSSLLADERKKSTEKELTAAEITEYWHAGKTLPVETAVKYPPRPLRMRTDKGYNVLIDIAHQCRFVSLWGTAGRMHRMGYRTVTSQASLHSVLDPRGVSRIRIPLDEANRVWPFAWYPNFTYHVVITEQGNPRNPGYTPEEIGALEKFVKDGGGIIILGQPEKNSADWSLNTLAGRFGACVTPETVRFEGRNCAVVAPGKGWETVASADDKPVIVRGRYGKGGVYLVGHSDLLYYGDGEEQARKEASDRRMEEMLGWLCLKQKPLADEARLPQPMAGGGAIFPELETQNGDIVVFYARNQLPELIRVASRELNDVTEKVLGWLPSPPTKEPMYLILSGGDGGGWAVNARVPKENGIISMSRFGIISIYAHELAHTLRGPLGEQGTVAGDNPFGNSGEPHAGWFQGKIDAIYDENLKNFPNKRCRIFDDPQFLAIDLAEDGLEQKFGKGKDWQKIWYIWQKMDDRYGTTWYPRWLYIQHTRWSAEPRRKLTWEESVEDMSIAVGEDLFPFFRSIGVTLKRETMGRVTLNGVTYDLPPTLLQPTAPGNVRLEPIGDYKKPLVY